MYPLLIGWLATRDVTRDRKRRATFLASFNSVDAREVPNPTEWLVAATKLAVCEQLSKPDSASFLQVDYRACADGVLRAAGQVSFAGADDNRSECFYLIEFDPTGRPEVLDITDRDPVLRKQLPAPEAAWTGGTVSYASASTPPVHRDWFWPIFWLVSLLVLGVLGTMALLA